jgi:ABC-2 type transport system permease protein
MMSGFLILLRKELLQQIRTHRLLVVIAVFFIFGLGTPLLLHYLPALVPSGEGFDLPEFTAKDAVQEYIGTFGQLGLLAAILVAMGAVAKERESGTAAMVLCKPVGTAAFIVAKLAAISLTFLAGIVLGGVGCYVYTAVIFGDPGASEFVFANVIAGCYLLVCLSVTLMFSSFFRSQMAAGAVSLVCLIALTLTASLSIMKDYSPGALLGWAARVVGGETSHIWGALVVSLIVVVLTVIAAWQVFRKKEI